MPEETTQTPPAFYLENEPLPWPVKVRMPVPGGSFADYQFTGLFARLSGAEIDAITGAAEIQKSLAAARCGDDAEKTLVRLNEIEREIFASQSVTVPQIMVGWEGVKTRPGGADVPFTVEILQAQIRGANGEALAKGIWAAVGEIRNGYRLGNSAPLPAPGQNEEPAAAAETANP